MTEPSEENLNIQPHDNDGNNDSHGEGENQTPSEEIQNQVSQSNDTTETTSDEKPDESKAFHLPTNEEILQRINNELNNNPMEDTKQTTDNSQQSTENKPEKKKVKKEESTPVVVKKDQTILWLSLAVLVVTVGIYFWQNYRKKKDEENTIDLNQQQADGYNEQNYYQQ